MGSLLKEYLTLSAKHQESSEVEKDEKDIKISEVKLDSAKDAVEPDESSGQQEFRSLENGSAGTESQLCSTSESSTASLQQFKNIVAIVDPPRVGLHPTVSCSTLMF